MEGAMTAIEMTGTIDEQRQLKLDSAFPYPGPLRVRVLILSPLGEAEEDEAAWLRAAARNPAFASLREPEEDIYTSSDGKPFRDEA